MVTTPTIIYLVLATHKISRMGDSDYMPNRQLRGGRRRRGRSLGDGGGDRATPVPSKIPQKSSTDSAALSSPHFEPIFKNMLTSQLVRGNVISGSQTFQPVTQNGK